MKTAAVILNWNGRDFLERFLPGLVASVHAPSEVIIADNASSDDSLAWLAEKFPQIRTIVLDKNYGFTGGYNRALSQIIPLTSTKHDLDKEISRTVNPENTINQDDAKTNTDNQLSAEYYLLMNSDIEVENGWLEPLEAWMDTHPQCGACAPKLLSYSDRTKFEYAGAAGGLIDRYGYPFCRGRVPGRTELDCGQYDSPADVFWVSGACMMVRAALFARLGGFDERFFAHQEEIDLCWRLQLEGYKVTVVPQSKVYHLGGGTLPNDSPWKLELNYRNNLLMLGNNLAKTYALKHFKKYTSKHAGKPTRKNAVAAEKAARHGYKKARKTIFTRMVLDGCSAAAYLLTFRPKCFAAVCKAHRQYRQLKKDSGKLTDTYNYIVRTNGSATIVGIFSKWIVSQTFFRGRNIFDYLRKKL